MQFRYVQIGAKDIKALTNFYEKVLDFVPSSETKWLNGQEGKVYEAPGFNNDNKVIFGFVSKNNSKARCINDKGIAHIAFESIDVKACVDRLVKYGGTFQSTLDNPSKKPCVYCKDIEGNIVEFHIPFPSKDSSALNTILCLAHLKKDKAIRKEVKPSKLRFIHVNYICEDWRALCDFFNNVVGSEDTGKIKDHSGKFKENVIGVKDVHVVGKHVLLPNFYLSYPTIEIFTYSIKGSNYVPSLDDIGLNLIGFTSNDIESDINRFIDNGGKLINRISDDMVIVSDINDDLIILSK